MGLVLRAADHVPAAKKAAWLAAAPYRDRLAHLRAHAAPRPPYWPTLGGDNSRARNGDPLPTGLRMLWQKAFLGAEPPTFQHRSTYSQREHSPLLPFYPVFDEKHIYVHVGARVIVFARETGAILYTAPDGQDISDGRVDVMLSHTPGVRAATVVGGVLYFNRVEFPFGERPRHHNSLVAFDNAFM